MLDREGKIRSQINLAMQPRFKSRQLKRRLTLLETDEPRLLNWFTMLLISSALRPTLINRLMQSCHRSRVETIHYRPVSTILVCRLKLVNLKKSGKHWLNASLRRFWVSSWSRSLKLMKNSDSLSRQFGLMRSNSACLYVWSMAIQNCLRCKKVLIGSMANLSLLGRLRTASCIRVHVSRLHARNVRSFPEHSHCPCETLKFFVRK